MIRLREIVLAVLICSAHAAFAQEADVDCNNAETQADMNYCADQEFQNADKELNAVYQQTLKSQQDIDKQQAELNPEYTGAVKALKKAQRAWIDFRDGHCEGVGFEARGGSMEPMLVSGCLAELTKARTRQLRELMQGTGD